MFYIKQGIDTVHTKFNVVLTLRGALSKINEFGESYRQIQFLISKGHENCHGFLAASHRLGVHGEVFATENNGFYDRLQ